MGGVSGNVLGLKQLIKKFDALASDRWRLAFSHNVAEEYTNFTQECFDNSRSPNGEPWAPLSPRSRSSASGQKSPQILRDTDAMYKATAPNNVTIDGFFVTVSVMYASVHQFGAVIVPVKAKFLRWGAYEYSSAVTSVYKSGKRKGQAKTTSVTRTEKGPFFAKKVTIPARPFLPLSGMPPELQKRLEEATIEALTEHFGGK